jgi:hypothetical protein
VSIHQLGTPPERDLRMFKYPLFDLRKMGGDFVTVRMPEPLGVQHVGLQGGTIMLWSLVDTGAAPKDRCFHIIGTGALLSTARSIWMPFYLGTVFDQQFVWHIFEVAP